MDLPTLDISYYVALVCCLAAAILALTGRVTWWPWAGWLALAASLGHVAGMAMVLGRPPLSGPYEAAAVVALWLAVLAQFGWGLGQSRRLLAGACWLAGAALLAIFLVSPRRLFPDWYMYGFLWPRLFFLLRWAAVGLALHGAMAAVAAPMARRAQDEAAAGRLLARARNFLLLATAVYLSAEFSGFTWRLLWLGDYWCWNRNFLESTLFFLLLTAALHLPPRWAAKMAARATALAIPGLTMTTVLMIHLLLEP